MEKFKIKSITLQDADFLFKLMNHPLLMSKLNETPTTKQDWVEAVLSWENDSDENGYIIWDDKKQIGWFAFNGLLSDDKVPYLKMAVLLPEYHNKGIGTLVLTKLLSIIREKGFTSVRLITNQDNLNAQKCYQKCGFQIIDNIENKMRDNTIVKRCIMECKL